MSSLGSVTNQHGKTNGTESKSNGTTGPNPLKKSSSRISNAAKGKIGSDTEVSIRGGTRSITVGSAKKREDSPAPQRSLVTFHRSGSFAASTSSSRQKEKGAGQLSEPNSPLLKPPSNNAKPSRGVLKKHNTLPGSQEIQVISKGGSRSSSPTLNLNSLSASASPTAQLSRENSPIFGQSSASLTPANNTLPGSAEIQVLSKAKKTPSSSLSLTGTSRSPSPSPNSLIDSYSPPGAPAGSVILGSTELQAVNKTQRPSSSPDLTSLPPPSLHSTGAVSLRRSPTFLESEEDFDDSKEKSLERTATEIRFGIDLSKYGSGALGVHTRIMMQSLLEGRDYQIPPDALSALMDTPQLPEDQPFNNIQITPAPAVEIDSLSAITLNAFFPDKERPPINKFRLDDELDIDAMVELIPILPSAEEIRALPLSRAQIEKVKQLNLFQVDISDEQLAAIAGVFSSLEKISISMCPGLGDAGVASLSRLKHLKSVDIRYCTKLTPAGIGALPLEQMEEFGLSTSAKVEAPIVARLAASPLLRRIDFILCPHLRPEALMHLSQAHQAFPITVNIRGCDRILAETIEAINRDRKKQSITFKFGAADEADRSGATVPYRLLLPPLLPKATNILSNSSIPVVFRTLELPDASAITDYKFERIPNFQEFIGFDLTNQFPGDFLDALIQRFPEMELIRIVDNSNLSHLGMLKQLIHAKTLYLGKLKGVATRWIETLFTNQANSPAWQELTDIHLYEMHVSDETLKCLSLLPKLKKITLASCDLPTVQGLKHLARCPALESLTVVDCPGIDPFAFDEFRAVRPQVDLKEDSYIDISAVRLSIEEADEIMWSPTAKRKFFFLRELLKQSEPIPENGKIELENEVVNTFYATQLARLGIQIPIDDKTDLQTQWMRADQILQAYVNNFRSAWAIRKELFRLGFFLNVEQQRALQLLETPPVPQSPEEMVEYMRLQIRLAETQPTPQSVIETISYLNLKVDLLDQSTVYVFRKQVQIFDASDSGITHIPGFMKSGLSWPKLKDIKLNGSYIETAPESFTSLCPQLQEKDLPPEMEDSKEPPPPPKKKAWDFLVPNFMKKKTNQ